MHTKVDEFWLRLSGNIKVIISSNSEVVELVLLITDGTDL
jgi:mannose-6-phosphate isomerase-like protein (cupin superfamily)